MVIPELVENMTCRFSISERSMLLSGSRLRWS